MIFVHQGEGETMETDRVHLPSFTESDWSNLLQTATLDCNSDSIPNGVDSGRLPDFKFSYADPFLTL